jgi:hypothetical protein
MSFPPVTDLWTNFAYYIFVFIPTYVKYFTSTFYLVFLQQRFAKVYTRIQRVQPKKIAQVRCKKHHCIKSNGHSKYRKSLHLMPHWTDILHRWGTIPYNHCTIFLPQPTGSHHCWPNCIISQQKGLWHALPGLADRPHLKRSSSLTFHKKAISQFMSLCRMPRDDINLQGNPTHSSAVNDVTTKAKKRWGETGGGSKKGKMCTGVGEVIFLACAYLSSVCNCWHGFLWLCTFFNGKYLVALIMWW